MQKVEHLTREVGKNVWNVKQNSAVAILYVASLFINQPSSQLLMSAFYKWNMAEPVEVWRSADLLTPPDIHGLGSVASFDIFIEL